MEKILHTLISFRANLGHNIPALFDTGKYPWAHKTDYDAICSCGLKIGPYETSDEVLKELNKHRLERCIKEKSIVKMDLKRSIKIELIRTNNAIDLLSPSPNRDRCELQIMRTCMRNITKLVAEQEE